MLFQPLHCFRLIIIWHEMSFSPSHGHIHCIPFVFYPLPNLMLRLQQLSVLIKGCAALPLSQRACLIFCSLSSIKTEGPRELEQASLSLRDNVTDLERHREGDGKYWCALIYQEGFIVGSKHRNAGFFYSLWLTFKIILKCSVTKVNISEFV